jgi:hypothetical protein
MLRTGKGEMPPMHVRPLRKAFATGCRILTAALFLTFLVFQVYAAEKTTTYVAQDVIDGMVDKAYFILNSADDPSSGYTQERAVASAKAVAEQLRGMAQNDANRKYILGKVNELEGQIYLEEKGLLLEKERYKQKNALALIPQFNSALAGPRPGFAELQGIERRLQDLDPHKADEAAASIAQRTSALAREVPAAIEAALAAGRIDDARGDVAYCQLNATFLGLSGATCAALEAKVSARSNAADEREFVQKALERFRMNLTKGNLAEARKERLFSEGKLPSLRKRIVPYEWNRLNKEYQLLAGKLDKREDSLCTVARARLHEKGPSAAAAFLDTMMLRGVAPERIGKTDRLILEAVVEEKKSEHTASPVVVPVVSDSAKGPNALDDLVAAARKAAAEKNDSLSSEKTERVRNTQVEEVRRDRLRVAYTLWKMREEQKQTTEKQQALQELVDIYTSIELHKPAEAIQLFVKARDFLKKNLPPEDFAKIAATVERQGGDKAGK